jgi:hypothetical protein
MEQQVIKYQSDLFKQEATLTVDDKLNKLKGKVLLPEKQDQANRNLKGIKLPAR